MKIEGIKAMSAPDEQNLPPPMFLGVTVSDLSHLWHLLQSPFPTEEQGISTFILLNFGKGGYNCIHIPYNSPIL